MTAPLVFVDTETTGLALDDDIWEFAAVRREPDGAESELHLFIAHSDRRCSLLPESFRRDHMARWPAMGEGVASRKDAAELIDRFLRGSALAQRKAHIVGAVPNFDTERLNLLLGRHLGSDWRWPGHYHLVDVENLAVGYLRGRQPGSIPLHPPWESDELSAALGIDIPEAERHTAMGDVRWAMRIYDRIMS